MHMKVTHALTNRQTMNKTESNGTSELGTDTKTDSVREVKSAVKREAMKIVEKKPEKEEPPAKKAKPTTESIQQTPAQSVREEPLQAATVSQQAPPEPAAPVAPVQPINADPPGDSPPKIRVPKKLFCKSVEALLEDANAYMNGNCKTLEQDKINRIRLQIIGQRSAQEVQQWLPKALSIVYGEESDLMKEWEESEKQAESEKRDKEEKQREKVEEEKRQLAMMAKIKMNENVLDAIDASSSTDDDNNDEAQAVDKVRFFQ